MSPEAPPEDVTPPSDPGLDFPPTASHHTLRVSRFRLGRTKLSADDQNEWLQLGSKVFS